MDEKEAARRVAARFKGARGSMEPSSIRAAKAMYDELLEAEAKLHKAVQFSRVLSTEPQLDWLVEQLQENHKNMAEFVKNVKGSLEYVLRQDL